MLLSMINAQVDANHLGFEDVDINGINLEAQFVVRPLLLSQSCC